MGAFSGRQRLAAREEASPTKLKRQDRNLRDFIIHGPVYLRLLNDIAMCLPRFHMPAQQRFFRSRQLFIDWKMQALPRTRGGRELGSKKKIEECSVALVPIGQLLIDLNVDLASSIR